MKRAWLKIKWIITLGIILLGFWNILFAYLGLIFCFGAPLFDAVFKGSKSHCNEACGRAQMMEFLAKKCHLCLNKKTPRFLVHPIFRYSFLVVFLLTFLAVVVWTVLVAVHATSMQEVVILIWSIKVPWAWASAHFVPVWVAAFAYGFYSLLMTMTILSFVMMLLFRPRSWCAMCPMGTMTQLICKMKNGKKYKKKQQELSEQPKPSAEPVSL